MTGDKRKQGREREGDRGRQGISADHPARWNVTYKGGGGGGRGGDSEIVGKQGWIERGWRERETEGVGVGREEWWREIGEARESVGRAGVCVWGGGVGVGLIFVSHSLHRIYRGGGGGGGGLIFVSHSFHRISRVEVGGVVEVSSLSVTLSIVFLCPPSFFSVPLLVGTRTSFLISGYYYLR